MKALQDEFNEEADLRFVSITVDPDRDTPEVLETYADSVGADPERWFFLTGEKDVIHRFAQEGFRLGAAEIAHEHRPASGATHTHSPRFVLIDGDAQIRGYYTSTDPEALCVFRGIRPPIPKESGQAIRSKAAIQSGQFGRVAGAKRRWSVDTS